MSNITLPRGDGLSFYRNRWYVCYYRDGKPAKLSTGTDDFEEAKKARDAFYAEARASGAKTVGYRTAKDKVDSDPDKYIYRRKPFIVRIAGKCIGEAETVVEARALRDAHLT